MWRGPPACRVETILDAADMNVRATIDFLIGRSWTLDLHRNTNTRYLAITAERAHCEHKFIHGLSADQVFLNDALQYFRSGGVIPNPVRIDDRDWPLLAYAKTIRLGAIDAALALQQPALRQALLQKLPRDVGDLAWRAFRIGLIRAQKNVPAQMPDTQTTGQVLKPGAIFVRRH